MTVDDIMKQLASYGDDRTKRTLMKHGAREPLYGVKVADLKKILKKTKKNHELSLALYATGNSDAMYLAGLMADEKQITREDLDLWVKNAYWSYLSEYTVPWVAAETPYGLELGLAWRTSATETIAAAGWATLSSYAAMTDDQLLDIAQYADLLDEVETDIHQAQNRVKYAMNGFVIGVGTHIADLTPKALLIADRVGLVTVDMNGTACKVPSASMYIQKVIDKNRVGKKKKTARC